MDETARHLISGTVAFLVVTLFMGKLYASANAKPEEKAGWRIISFGKATEIAMWVAAIFFSTIAVLAAKFPGRTSPEALPWAIACFIGFALLGLFTAMLLPRAEVRFNKTSISGADLLGKRHEMTWEQITNVEFARGLDGFRITGNGQSIWIYPTMRGFKSILPRLNKEVERLGLPPIELANSAPSDEE